LIIKLLSPQVVTYWDTIKFVVAKVDEVDEADLPEYLLELLHALLSDKAQCWVRVDESRMIVSMIITRILKNKIGAGKHVYIQCVYLFQKETIQEWQKLFDTSVEFAKHQGCDEVRFDSMNPKVWKLANAYNCREANRSFVYGVSQ